ncbi:hypothetical protein [Egicoccus halophilus]|uniref:Uncharacterized protein n=1 Tax=Egicoccus halophilus TaxID=1670830 RepID=A0A8J3EUI4_9ACTN|nr:hypothetical protein [Egicoccus halophilus]GGI07271.1 hypothetical protein GCM10011354_23250 [Egicoccus halophilus]
MSAASDPWWSSPPGTDGLDDADPVDAHRTARRGTGPVDGAAGDERVGPDPRAAGGQPGDHDPAAGARPGAPDGHDPDVCGVCPWCVGLRLLATTHPEVVGHLTEAARHLADAVRALAGDLHRTEPGRSPYDATTGDPDDEPFEHIDLD